MKNLYLLVGPSGCGKSTIADKIAKNLNCRLAVSFTDRPKRKPDESGYTFLSRNEFTSLGDIWAPGTINGFRYGITEERLNDCDIYIIEPSGVEHLKKNYTKRPIRVIGITSSEAELTKRMASRNDSTDKITERLKDNQARFSPLPHTFFDVLFSNNDLDETVSAIENYIASLERLQQTVYILNEVCERNINTPVIFTSKQDAYDEMHNRLAKVLGMSLKEMLIEFQCADIDGIFYEATGVYKGNAWAECEGNNYDWKITEMMV